MPYTLPVEQKLHAELLSLLDEWKKIVCTEQSSSNLFVEDGFYPFYTQQPVKILFIGREALGMAVLKYIEFLFNEKTSGTGSLPSSDQGWHRKIRAKPIKTPLAPCFSIACIM